MSYYVEVVERSTGEVVNRIGPLGYVQANRVDAGININMNHAEFKSRIVDEQGKEVDD